LASRTDNEETVGEAMNADEPSADGLENRDDITALVVLDDGDVDGLVRHGHRERSNVRVGTRPAG
jgi:hypothetical protein